jgi:hypothetical protein
MFRLFFCLLHAFMGALLLCASLALWPAAANAAEAKGDPSAKTQPWAGLSQTQQQILAPLTQQWHQLDAVSQEKWLRVAARYPSLPPDAQQRVLDRMNKWAALPDSERGQARLRFQQAQQMSPEERQQRWQAYQALPPQEREALARVGWRKKNPVLLEQSQTGPREMAQAQTQRARSDEGAGKQNMVGAPATLTPSVVAPALVSGGSGATTSLVNQMATPPMHQQVGLPKINTSQGFVNPQTMLPLRGQQGAGMTPIATKP